MNSPRPPDHILVRLAVPDDFSDPAFHHCLGNLSPGPVNHDRRLLAARDKVNVLTLVAFTASEGVVGTASFWSEPKLTRGGGMVVHVEDVAVRPDWEGRGVGRRLMEYLHDFVATHGGGLVRRIELACADDKVGFYEKLGYKRAGVAMRLDLPCRSLAEVTG